MCEIRERSVVRSSVTPSAKYCCSGSLLRLANGSTTIDKRGATAGSNTDWRGCAFSPVVPTATGGGGEGPLDGQSHQARPGVASAPPATIPHPAGGGGPAPRRPRGAPA